jgi:OmpA-OmpF porin, OOP family
MRMIEKRRLAPVLAAAFILILASLSLAQDTGKTVQVAAGQKMKVEGIILAHQPDGVTLRSLNGTIYNIAISGSTEMKEKKGNPFRGAKQYSKVDLAPGLQVEAKGTGNSSGSIAATEIRFKNDDFLMAQAMAVRVAPVENQVKETQARLGQDEQNAQKLSGEVQELSAASDRARSAVKAAQETANNAMGAANDARSRADNAQAGVKVTNERITSLDEYQVKESTIVHFNAGSVVLTKKDKEELQKLADQVKSEKGFVIEVAGFASADGNVAFNRKLSQRRADAVIQYMAENYVIPMRRFITPMGYGESQPVADNHTRTGRTENRRVEVRILVSNGLAAPAESSAPSVSSLK